MKHPLLITAALASGLALAGCASDRYGRGYVGYSIGYAAPYDAYYDGYYGPIYDGYWGSNGIFYYRTTRDQRAYIAGGRDHFRRDRGDGDHWRQWRGTVTPQRGYTMPYYRNQRGHRGDRDGDRHRERRDDD